MSQLESTTTLVTIDPIQAFLWTLRRNEKDVIHLYNSLSPIMELATGTKMLNFGYWKGNIHNPAEAQSQLCTLVGRAAELDSSEIIVDIGSGYGAPANQWRNEFNPLQIVCVNINAGQLIAGFKNLYHKSENEAISSDIRNQEKINFINSTSLALPFAKGSVDRVISLESAQHFKPLDMFISESARILQSNGLFVMAMPVTIISRNLLKMLIKLGILNLTWSSEHYRLDYVKSLIARQRFKIIDLNTIGPQVYEPLAEYYFQNREVLRDKILTLYPSYIEKILSKSLLKMWNVSREGIVDYVIIKAQKS
jgi:cyclopropane fatty-acyl-phospholipid synthase-like methyltransferase